MNNKVTLLAFVGLLVLADMLLKDLRVKSGSKVREVCMRGEQEASQPCSIQAVWTSENEQRRHVRLRGGVGRTR